MSFGVTTSILGSYFGNVLRHLCCTVSHYHQQGFHHSLKTEDTVEEDIVLCPAAEPLPDGLCETSSFLRALGRIFYSIYLMTSAADH